MAKFPEPPDTLPAPEVRTTQDRLWRIFFAAGAHPTPWSGFRGFGPVDARFDPHLPPPRVQERAVMYAATDARACFAEVWQVSRLIDRRAGAPTLVAFDPTRPLRLLDLTGTWPTRAGASMAINTGSRARARRWSQAIYAQFPDLDGLWYASSMYANTPAVALYERARDAMPRHPRFHRRLDAPELLSTVRNVAAEVGYLLG